MRRISFLLALAGAAMAWPVAAQAPAQEAVVNGVAYMRAATPPAVLQQMMDARRTGTVTRPVMERSADAEVRAFRDYLDRTVKRERSKTKQLELVNTYVNRRVKQIEDKDLYANADLWAPPLNTLLVGGDCEDIVLLKRWALIRVGFDSKDLYLMGGVSRALGQPAFHAVLFVLTPPDKGVVLDSLSDAIHATTDDAHFGPTYALNETGFWRIETPKPEDKPYLDEIKRTSEPVVIPLRSR